MPVTFHSLINIAWRGGRYVISETAQKKNPGKHCLLILCAFRHPQAVLHFMTGCTATEESAAVSQDVVKVLVLSGLMKWLVLS